MGVRRRVVALIAGSETRGPPPGSATGLRAGVRGCFRVSMAVLWIARGSTAVGAPPLTAQWLSGRFGHTQSTLRAAGDVRVTSAAAKTVRPRLLSTKRQSSPSRRRRFTTCRAEHLAIVPTDRLVGVGKRVVGLDRPHLGQIDGRGCTLQPAAEVLRIHRREGRPTVGSFTERVDERAVLGETGGEGRSIVRLPRVGKLPEEGADASSAAAMFDSPSWMASSDRLSRREAGIDIGLASRSSPSTSTSSVSPSLPVAGLPQRTTPSGPRSRLSAMWTRTTSSGRLRRDPQAQLRRVPPLQTGVSVGTACHARTPVRSLEMLVQGLRATAGVRRRRTPRHQPRHLRSS